VTPQKAVSSTHSVLTDSPLAFEELWGGGRELAAAVVT